MTRKRKTPKILSREEKKAQLLTRLEKAIDELLDWEEQQEKPNFTQIEDMVLKVRQEMGAEMAAELLSRPGAKTPVPGPACPKCGQEMRLKGDYRKQIEARLGAVDYERSYYYCPACEEGIFPPG